MKHEAKIFGVAAALFIGGASQSMGQQTSVPRPNRGIRGTQVYGKFLGPDHTIEFYEFTPGHIAIRESKSADDGQPVFMDKIGQVKTLADVYRRLNPRVTAVPQQIRDADRRAAAARASAEVRPHGPNDAPPAMSG